VFKSRGGGTISHSIKGPNEDPGTVSTDVGGFVGDFSPDTQRHPGLSGHVKEDGNVIVGLIDVETEDLVVPAIFGGVF
jgi:hypothetical protein